MGWAVCTTGAYCSMCCAILLFAPTSLGWSRTSLDESPRWFLEVGRRKDAAEVFRRIAVKNGRGDDPKVMEAIAEIERDDDDVAKEESSLQLFHDAWTQYKALWDAKRRCTTAAVWAVWFGFGLAYYGVTLLVTRISPRG